LRLVLAALLPLALLGCVETARREARRAAAGGEGPRAGLAATPSAPNLVVVLSDDHRWDALGAAGNPAIVTPVMDRLAGGGVYFRQAIASVSQCHPVRASLLTGLPSHRHGVYSLQSQAPGVAETLCARRTVPSALRDVGYRTVMVGKWHLPTPPSKCGFDEVRTWLPDGGTHYRAPELVRGADGEHQTVPGFTQEIFADDAVDFLRGPAARRGPFLLWLGFTAPHFPYAPNPDRIAALYAGRRDEELLPPRFPRHLATDDWRSYDEAVSHLDEQLGRVLAALGETGLAANTVVVLLGDNGHMMGERGIGGPGSRSNVKQVPYESSLRVPFVMAGPGLPKALVSDLPVSSLDLPPTLLALAGLPAPGEWPGRDLTAALAGELDLREAFAEWSDEESEKFGRLAFRAVRTPTHKLIVWKETTHADELYDLVADPSEARNLREDATAQPVLRDLRGRLEGWMRRNDDPALAWPAKR
jgi:N-acetylglucosamine-6-sulfatase